MSPRKLLVAFALLVAVLFSVGAIAQVMDDDDDDIDDMLEQNLSSATIQQLQAQVNAPVPKSGDKRELAAFYHKRGVANSRLGNYDRAIDDYKLALEDAQTLVLLKEKGATRYGVGALAKAEWGNRPTVLTALCNTVMHRGQLVAAVDCWDRLAQENQRANPFAYHRAKLNLMTVYTRLGQWPAADKARQEAEATAPRLPNIPRKEAAAQGLHGRMMAAAYAGQGNYVEGERGYRAALKSAEQVLEDRRSRLGPTDRRAQYAAAQLRNAQSNLAEILSTRGKYGEAEAYARAGLEGALTMFAFNAAPVKEALSVVGWTRFQQGDVAGAEKYYRAAVADVEGSDVMQQSRKPVKHQFTLANALAIQGRWEEALKLFEEHGASQSGGNAGPQRSSSDVGWPYALHKTGQSQRAAEMLGRSIAAQLKRPTTDQWYLAQLRGLQGVALAATGNTADALKAYRESIPDLIRRDHDDSEQNTGYWRVFWQRSILEAYLELLAKLHAAGQTVANLDLVDESFRIADLARGSSVQEAITATAARGQLPDKNLADLARKDQDGLNRIVALNRILAGLAGSADERTAKILSDVRAEVARLRKEHAVLRADIRKRYPEYAELIDPKPPGVSDVSKSLAATEALVSIYLGESQSYVWTIGSGGKAAFRVVPIKREEVERDVRELRRAMDFGEGSIAQIRPFDLGRAHKLYRAFFEPDEALWKEAQIMNVIPHGALGELPFSLLVTVTPAQSPAGAQPAYAEVPWLMRKAAISQLPSASAFAALRRTSAGKAGRQPFVGFGDPVFTVEAGADPGSAAIRNLTVRKIADAADQQLNVIAKGKGAQQSSAVPATRTLSQAFTQLSALPDTADELREIAATLKADPARDLFLNRQATERNVKQVKLENTRVVAFATHGIAPGELTGLDQPALALSNPALTGDRDNDGFLTMEEVLGLKLDADWVVLSACNTGSADGRGSEAVSGLGRAFFYAGARSLLVSNWAVETTSARLLTTELFRRQAENPQLTRAEALRQSMLSLMGKSATGAASFSYAHPAFWAPFSLVGDGGP